MTDKNLVLNLNKPYGITSQRAVTRVKRLYYAKKAGHAGTLDPTATGVLLICLNEATKITRFLSEFDKEYIATMKLGERTDTFDSEGKIIRTVENFSLDMETIEKTLERFKGTVKQTPPMYSAVKVSGKPLYKLARKGIEVHRRQKEINIYKIDIVRFDNPILEIRVSCSKGTYIRTLCDDLGTALGMGAHVISLKRTKIGDFNIEDSMELEELPGNEKALCPIDTALRHFNEIVFNQENFLRALNGVLITPENSTALPINSYLRLKNPEGKLFAIGRLTDSKIKIERLLNVLSNGRENAGS